MRRRRSTVAAVLACMLGLLASGCADEATVPSGGGTTGPPAQTVTPTPTPARPVAVAVRVVLSGGIGGAHRVWRLRRGAVPDALSAAEADRVLALAGSEAIRTATRRPMAAPPCCDRQRVEVSVRYADGARVRTTAVLGGDAPREVRRMVAVLAGASSG